MEDGLSDEAVGAIAVRAAMLVLVFGYQEGEAAAREALDAALDDGTWDQEAEDFPYAHMRQDEDLNWRLASPALEAHVVGRVCGWLATEPGLQAVLRYVAATFQDLGPVGGTVEGVADRIRARFPAA
jgi:hypothetical protein